MSAARKTKHQPPALPRIFTVRGKKVVLDSDLAKLYGVPTFRLNEAVKRNASRFPADFSFVLSREEFVNLISQFAISRGEADGDLKSQFATSSSEEVPRSQIATLKTDEVTDPRSQFAILKNRHGGSRKLSRVFTEHGALMAANVLRSERAVEMSLYLIRAFVEMREALLANATILKRLAEIDHRLIEHDSVLREVVERLQPLLDAPPVDESAQPKIGFHRGNR